MHRVISRYRRNVRRAVLLALTALLMLVNVPAGATPEPFLQEVSFPTNMAFLPDGTLLFTEKETGDVRAVTPGGELLDRPSATLQVMPDAERGLLGIAVHPDFEREPWIYLYFSDPADGLNRLVRVRTDGSRPSGEPEILLVGLSASAGYHNGGDMVFAADGTLFLAIGEAHESDRAQDPNDIGGKVVRLTADGGVPADNPFGAANPVWSIGHRNSFGLCIDPATGELWETENGTSVDDEVNLIEEGANYGWPVVTGRAGDDRFVDPVAVFVSPIALTGCVVVDGSVWFGSFDGRLWRLDADDDAAAPEQIARFPSGVTDVALGPDRVLYVATTDAIWTVELAFDAGPERSAWKTWVATGAIAVLVASLGARFLAGRSLRGDRPSVGA